MELLQVSDTWCLLPKTEPNYCYLLCWWQLFIGVSDVSEQEAKGEGGVLYTCSLDLAACHYLAIQYPAGRKEVGDASGCLYPSSDSQRGKLQQQNPEVQATRLGHRCSTLAPRCLSSSDACPTAGAASNHVSLFRTSQTFTTLHPSWQSSRGMEPCPLSSLRQTKRPTWQWATAMRPVSSPLEVIFKFSFISTS